MAQIPKIIHYCWFGGKEYPELVNKCIASWKKVLFDYQFIKWHEDNFDIRCNDFVKEAYEKKKYAFVSDYARLFALYNFGGIYLDTDVEVLKSFDIFLINSGFLGFESKDSVATAVIGSVKNNNILKELLSFYDNKKFINLDGTLNTTTNVAIITRFFSLSGLVLNGKKQKIRNFTFYPQEIFCPNDLSVLFTKDPKNSYTIHHFDESWREKRKNKKFFIIRFRHFFVGCLRNTIGTKIIEKISKLIFYH